jgi:hypothetical protein
MPHNEFPLWRGNERVDGVLVCRARDACEADEIPEGYENTWIVVPTGNRPAIVSCPCCVGIIRNRRAAQIIADARYPVVGGSA